MAHLVLPRKSLRHPRKNRHRERNMTRVEDIGKTGPKKKRKRMHGEKTIEREAVAAKGGKDEEAENVESEKTI